MIFHIYFDPAFANLSLWILITASLGDLCNTASEWKGKQKHKKKEIKENEIE